MAELHPAIPLILDAEQTPVFRFATQAVDERLAVASQLQPASLPAPWVLRLAHRYAEILIQAGDLDRAALWVGTAAGSTARTPASDVRHSTLEARAALRGANITGARAALSGAVRQLAALANDRDAHGRANLLVDLATAELQTTETRFGAVVGRLQRALRQTNLFASQDDIWRCHQLLAKAHHNRLAFGPAADLYRACVDLCASHGARQDQAEALVSLGRCTLAVGEQADAMALFERAHALTEAERGTFRHTTMALFAGHMAKGDLPAAIRVVQRASIEAAKAQDARGWLDMVGVVVNLRRIQQNHKQAYRELLGIYGQLKQRFGEGAAQPALDLIELLQRDLGPQGFEAMAAELLAEMQAN